MNRLYGEVRDRLPRRGEKMRRPCPDCGGRESERLRPQYEFVLERCRGCGCVFLNDLYDPDTQQSIDNEFTRLMRVKHGYYCLHPEAGIQGDFEGEPRPELVHEELRLLLGVTREAGWADPRGRSMLDVGCFKGYSVYAAQLAGFEATGIEFDEKRLRFAREVLKVRVVATLFEKLEAEGRQYDLITARHVLEHIHDPVPFLEKARRLLRPGGRLFILLPNFYSEAVRRMYEDGALSGDFTIHHVNYFDPARTSDLVRRAGLRIAFAGTAGSGRVTLRKRYGIGPGFVGWYRPLNGGGPLAYRLRQWLKGTIIRSRRRAEAERMVREGTASPLVPGLTRVYSDGDRGGEICVIATPP
jgi:2-polyprenyl-3-methyl-5-hydroxy-6-metoxy-1,4-benzoquinol methylase